jgi:predicted CXXCH cytochrome family protein
MTVHLTNGANGTNGTNGTSGTSCTVSAGDAGGRVIRCADGTSVTVNDGQSATCTVTADADSGVRIIRCSDGTVTTIRNGMPGTNGLGVRVADLHGMAHILSSGEYANGAKVLARAAITSATADPAGVVTVNFTVATQAGAPIVDVPAISANISKLVPAATGEASNHWVPYIWATETVPATGTFPNPAGTTALQATRETNGTLTNHRDGSYTYVFSTNLTSARMGTTPITYERNRTHRLVIMMGGHSGATADAHLDFVPDGTAITERRDIIQTANCQACHNENEFRGHGGDRLSIEACTSCHVDGARDANSGNSLALNVMIHKIHAGAELPSVVGADGIRYDNPATTVNEAADNGSYAIYGYRGTRASWEHAEFPSVLSNCTKCHQGSGAQVDNWMNRPSRAACGSCHDNVNFATGVNHVGGSQANDGACSTCHTPSGPQELIRSPVATMHDWTNRDVRNKPEFAATVTVSTPANGMFFVRGESPVVSVVLRDAVTNALVDHTTLAEDPAAEGCPAPTAANRLGGPCPPRDGLLRSASLFVSGPRAHRMPVLTTAARSQLFSSSAGPFDLSAAGASLIVQFDQGALIHTVNSTGGDVAALGTVTVPVSSGTFASAAAATPAEVVAWLNRNAAFAARGIAWVESNGRVGIRSRNLGTVFSIQLQASAVATSVFAGDLTAHMPTGSTPSNNISRRTVAANQDPRVSYTAGAIRYQLDPVDDLAPGTYIASF